MILERIAPAQISLRLATAELRARRSASDLLHELGTAIAQRESHPPESLQRAYKLSIQITETLADFSHKQLLATRIHLLASATSVACEVAALARRAGRHGAMTSAQVGIAEEQLDSLIVAIADIMAQSIKPL